MKKLAVTIAICAIGHGQVAAAICSVPQPRMVCAEYSASQVVLDAKLIRIAPLLENNDPNDIDGYFYTLKTTRLLRGSAEPIFRIYEGNDSGRASFNWRVGTKYVLFLFPSHENSGPNIWALDGCGNSGPVSKSASVLNKIAHINPNAKSGTIAGVVSDPNLSLGLWDVQLAVRGPSGAFKLTTDRKGRFQVNVPPGDYSIEPIRPSSPLVSHELSYEDARHLKIQPGSCVQVQLTQRARP
jgi:hypothetical protein